MNNLAKTDYQHAIKVKEVLEKMFKDVISQIYCYGSKVTLQTQDTDFDLLILTKTKIDWRLEDEISSAIFNYGIENDILFDTKYFSKEEFETTYSFMPFIKEVKSYGISI